MKKTCQFAGQEARLKRKRSSIYAGRRAGSTSKKAKAVVNAEIVKCAAIGIVKSHDSRLLASNGGHIVCSYTV